MADTLEIFGVEYVNATGIKATDDNGIVRAFVRPQGTKGISANGTGIDVTAYASVDVSVTPLLQAKTVTPTTSQQVITPDNSETTVATITSQIGSSRTGTITIAVDLSDLVIGRTYHGVGSGSANDYTTMSAENWSVDTTIEYTSGVTLPCTSSNPGTVLSWISISASSVIASFKYANDNRFAITSLTFLEDTGSPAYDGLSQVTVNAIPSGTEGTPTASKGTVSNHQVSVTPSVTNTTGYITGGTKTGTAVTVTASELASGNKAITANGTNIDVVGYSTVSVAVPFSTIYSGSSAPSATTGTNGDVYIQTA